jgi:sulfonate transport system substrate-binding protein
MEAGAPVAISAFRRKPKREGVWRSRERHLVGGLSLAAALVLMSAGCAPNGQRPSSAQVVLKIASQKGATKALVLASHVLDGAPYRVEWSEFPSAQALLEALGANAVDLGGVGDAPFLFAYANDAKLKVVHVGKSLNGGGAVGVVVPSTSPIRAAADLRGRRIATGKGSIGHYLLLRVLDQAHIPLSAVQVVYLSPGDAKAALANGAVDAWSTWSPYTDLETRGGGGRVVIDGTGLLNTYLFMASTDQAIAAKRPELADFIVRLARAERWQSVHVAEFAKVLAADTGLPPGIALAVAQKHIYTPTSITPALAAEEQATLQQYVDGRVLPAAPATAQAFDPEFNATINP